MFSKNSLATTDFLARKTQLVNYCENPLPGNPTFAIANHPSMRQVILLHRIMSFWDPKFTSCLFGARGEPLSINILVGLSAGVKSRLCFFWGLFSCAEEAKHINKIDIFNILLRFLGTIPGKVFVDLSVVWWFFFRSQSKWCTW